ncbi:MAG: hypothetical protein DMG59_08765 [Acidobacteria bacterium]|nr:MAG: hypothetical protein DMG59_08765 [Acidobacteriota bacterium]
MAASPGYLRLLRAMCIAGSCPPAALRTQRAAGRNSPTGGRLRLKLVSIEAEVGRDFPLNKRENFPNRTSLIHFQEGLQGLELILSFDREGFGPAFGTQVRDTGLLASKGEPD